MDQQHRSKRKGTAYFGTKTELKIEVVDKFGNVITQLGANQYDLTISYNNVFHRSNWEMRSGTIFALFFPKFIGKTWMVVRLVNKRSKGINDWICSCQMPIEIIRPPYSPLLTLKNLDDPEQCCTIGGRVNLEVKLYDMFGNKILQEPEESFDIDAVISPPIPRMKEERVDIEKIKTLKSVHFSVTVCLEVSGLRKVELFMTSGSMSNSKEVHIKVLPATPHHLTEVSFTTNNIIDKSFSPDPTVIYRNQWSTLIARLVFYHDNIDGELANDCDVTLELRNDKGKTTGMGYNHVKIENEAFRVALRISKVGKYDLFITLRSKSNPDQVYRLKKIPTQVINAPLYLARSKFNYSSTCVAGKEFKIKIIPFDVLGCAMSPTSIADYNLAALIPECYGKREITNLRITRNGSSVGICVSVVLVQAGCRKIRILDKKRNATKPNMHLRGKENMF